MLIGARTAAFSSGNQEEEMYKELLFQVLSRNATSDVYEVPGLTTLGFRAFDYWNGQNSNVFPLTISLPDLISIGEYAFSNCFFANRQGEILCPNCSTLLHGAFRDCIDVKKIVLGHLTSVGSTVMSGTGMRVSSVGLNVYVSNTVDELEAFSGFFESNVQSHVKYHCTDGYWSKDDGVWTKHPST